MGHISKLDLKKLIFELQSEIDNNPCQYFSLNDFCIKNKQNLKYISQKFKSFVGMPFHDYRISAKMNRAKKFLLNTDKTVNQISEDLGYYNPSSLMKIFKKETGITPSQYRKESLTKSLVSTE